MAQKALDMMCERALSRETQGSLLADKQFVQGYIADSYAQLVQFRLFVLYTAWEIDKYNDYKRVRKDIAVAKVVMPDRAPRHRVAGHAGARRARRDERDAVLRDDPRRGRDGAGRRPDRGPQDDRRQPGAPRLQAGTDGMWPTEWIPGKQEAAQGEVSPHVLEHEVGNL